MNEPKIDVNSAGSFRTSGNFDTNASRQHEDFEVHVEMPKVVNKLQLGALRRVVGGLMSGDKKVVESNDVPVKGDEKPVNVKKQPMNDTDKQLHADFENTVNQSIPNDYVGSFSSPEEVIERSEADATYLKKLETLKDQMKKRLDNVSGVTPSVVQSLIDDLVNLTWAIKVIEESRREKPKKAN